jgi:hypothetical protein
VRIERAQHRVAVRAQFSVGVRRRARVVRPVVHRGDAGIGELDQAEHHAVVEIRRFEQLRRRVLGGEIAEAVADEVAADRAPHVIVGVDEAGHHDHVAGVDRLGAGGDEIGADRLDAAVAHQDIGARQHAGLVDGDDGAVADQIAAAGAALSERRRDGGGGGHARQRRCSELAGKCPAAQHRRLLEGCLIR